MSGSARSFEPNMRATAPRRAVAIAGMHCGRCPISARALCAPMGGAVAHVRCLRPPCPRSCEARTATSSILAPAMAGSVIAPRSEGHRCVALDTRDDHVDGLGAAQEFLAEDPDLFRCVTASFEDLPFAPESFDVTLFNASLHYAQDLARTLAEASRVTRHGGIIAILDSPFYRRAADGEAMVAEKKSRGAASFGAQADVLLSPDFIEYLTPERLCCRPAGIALDAQARALSALVRASAFAGAAERRAQAITVRSVDRGQAMILLVNPRATRPGNRRFPLSVMAIGAALPASETWEIVDGNLPDIDPLARIGSHVDGAKRHRRSGARDRVHRDAGTAACQCRSPDEGRQSTASGHSHHLGRQFRKPLSRAGSERALCRLADPRAGRAHLHRTAGCAVGEPRSGNGGGLVLPQSRWHASHRRRNAAGSGPANCRRRRITRFRWPNIFAPPFWGSAPASIRRRSAVPMPAISVA